jgi:hypothetical protein
LFWALTWLSHGCQGVSSRSPQWQYQQVLTWLVLLTVFNWTSQDIQGDLHHNNWATTDLAFAGIAAQLVYKACLLATIDSILLCIWGAARLKAVAVT